MYVRTKRTRGRRYAYLAEGTREEGKVSQRIVCYLGPLDEVCFGVPPERRRKVERTVKPDWSKVNTSLRETPLTFDELARARTRRFRAAVGTRRPAARTDGTRARVEGKPEALAVLSAANFRMSFRKVGEGRYRMT